MTDGLGILYISGYGRSGSTLLDLCLGGLEGVSSLGQFRIDSDGAYSAAVGEVEDLESIRSATRVYREEEMSALESAQKKRASL